MLTFLNSAILFGLLAVSIPIIIHLFTRQKTKIVYFSSLKFLKELQKQKIRRLKIRQILLLILRALLILALVMVFARPTLRNTDASAVTSGARSTAVIILDNTLSMGRISEGRRLLDYAKDRAGEVAGLLQPGDETYLLYPQSPPKFAHEGPRYSLGTLLELVNETELSYSATDYVAALTEANHVLGNSKNLNKEVYLICDMQEKGLDLPQGNGAGKLLADNIKLFLIPITGKADAANLAIDDLTMENQILEKGKVAEVRVRIKNTSEVAVRNKLVHLFVNGKRQAQDVVNLEPQAAANLIFRIVPDRTGFQSGYVLLEDDDLLEDNRRYFTFNISDEIPILLVGKESADTHYLKLALRPQREVGTYLNIRDVASASLGQEDLSRYQVVVLSNVPKLASGEVQKLENFVKLGGGLMVFLGSDVDLRNYNENLQRKLQLPSLTQTFASAGEQQFLTLGKIDFSHPVFNGVFDEDKYVESPHVRFAVNIDASAPVEKIIEYSNGAPFLFESRLQKGRILYCTTSLARDWSDLVMRGLFVPLLNRGVSYLAGSAAPETEQLLVGDEIRMQSERISANANLLIEKPDASQVKIKPEVSAGAYFVRFTETNRPGIYKLYNGESLVAQWAVNYSPAELEMTEFETKTLEAEVPDGQMYEISPGGSVADKLTETRFGRELWKLFAALALLFILLETALFKEKGAPEAAGQEA